jgi:hypothetical protein
MSEITSPLADNDTKTIVSAIHQARENGRHIVAIEIHPARRLSEGAWKLDGIPLISNGLMSLNRFTLKVEGRIFLLDTLDFRFDHVE